MLRKLLARSVRTERMQTIAALREQNVIGILTLTGNDVWDARLNRSMILPAGVHLWTVDRASRDVAEGQMRLRVRATLLGERGAKSGEIIDLPEDGTLAMIAEDDEVHLWNLTNLLQRAGAGDERAAEDLLELELHVQQRAMAAALEGYEVPESMRWPDEA